MEGTSQVERITVVTPSYEAKEVRFHGDRSPMAEPLLTQEAPPRIGELPPTTKEFHRHTLLAAGANLAKAILGVGILALPRVFAMLGIGTASIFLAFVAILTYASLHLLTKATARTGLTTYSDVVYQHLGLVGQVFLDLAVIVNCFGLMMVYMIVIGDVLVGDSHGNEGLLSAACGDRRIVLAVVTLLVLAPMLSARNVRSATAASALGVTAIVIWAVVSLLLFGVAWSNGQVHHMNWWPHGQVVKGGGFEKVVQVAATLPIIVVAFICQMALHPALRGVAYLREAHINSVNTVALSLSAAAFLLISVSCYGVFGGKGIEADVLRNFTVDALQPLVWTEVAQAGFMTVRLAFLISLLATFPLQMTPFRDSLWKLLFRQELQGPGFWLVTYLSLVCVYLAASAITSIWEPLMIIGSTAGVLVAFVFPGALGMAMGEELTESTTSRTSRGITGAVLIIVGIVIGLAGIIRVIAYNDPLAG